MASLLPQEVNAYASAWREKILNLYQFGAANTAMNEGWKLQQIAWSRSSSCDTLGPPENSRGKNTGSPVVS